MGLIAGFIFSPTANYVRPAAAGYGVELLGSGGGSCLLTPSSTGALTITGGSASGANLTLSSTAHATKGKLIIGTSAYDEVNNRLGLGVASPSSPLHLTGTISYTATGSDNLRFGVNSSCPTIIWENTTGRMSVDVTTDIMRWIWEAAMVPMTLNSAGDMAITGNINATGTGNTKFNTGGGNFGIGVSGTPSGFQVGTATNPAALGVNNVRMGMNGTTPSLLLENNTSGVQWNIDTASGELRFVRNNATVPYSFGATDLTIGEAGNLILGTSTGTKFGTATSQKLGFFNATPVVQQTGSSDILASLVTLGLRAASSNPPMNMGTGALTCGTITSTGLATITQGTVGNAVQTLKSTATNDDPYKSLIQGRCATTGAAAVTIATIACPVNTSMMVRVEVTARRTGGTAGTAEDAAFSVKSWVFTSPADVLTQFATIEDSGVHSSGAGYTVAAVISGTNVLIQVESPVDTNVTWHANVWVSSVST